MCNCDVALFIFQFSVYGTGSSNPTGPALLRRSPSEPTRSAQTVRRANAAPNDADDAWLEIVRDDAIGNHRNFLTGNQPGAVSSCSLPVAIACALAGSKSTSVAFMNSDSLL